MTGKRQIFNLIRSTHVSDPDNNKLTALRVFKSNVTDIKG